MTGLELVTEVKGLMSIKLFMDKFKQLKVLDSRRSDSDDKLICTPLLNLTFVYPICDTLVWQENRDCIKSLFENMKEAS